MSLFKSVNTHVEETYDDEERKPTFTSYKAVVFLTERSGGWALGLAQWSPPLRSQRLAFIGRLLVSKPITTIFHLYVHVLKVSHHSASKESAWSASSWDYIYPKPTLIFTLLSETDCTHSTDEALSCGSLKGSSEHLDHDLSPGRHNKHKLSLTYMEPGRW